MERDDKESIIKELVKLYEQDEEVQPDLVPGPTWKREGAAASPLEDVVISVREVKEDVPNPVRAPPLPSKDAPAGPPSSGRAPKRPPLRPDNGSDSSSPSPTFEEVIDLLEVHAQGLGCAHRVDTTFSSSDDEEDDEPLACPVCRDTCLVSVCHSCYKNEKALMQGEARHEFLARAQLETKLLKFADQYGELERRLQETEERLRRAQDRNRAEVSLARVKLENKVLLMTEQNNELKRRLKDTEARLKAAEEGQPAGSERNEIQVGLASLENNELKQRLSDAEGRLRELEENSTVGAMAELEDLKAKLVATEERLKHVEAQDTDEALTEARVVIERQCNKIEELTQELNERKERYFDNIEDLAEGKMLMKQQQRRISELHEEASSEKRNRVKAEEWLFQLRDECVRLKGVVGERDKLRNDINSLLYSREELERKYSRLKESYHQLWDRNEELEGIFQRKDYETEKLRAGWEYTSNELHRVQGCVRSLQNYNEHLKAKLREVQVDQHEKYHEALKAAQTSTIDKLSDTHIDALISNLTKITGPALELFFPSDANPSSTIKKLMATMHPDRTTIPACKETLQKRFQLLNHLKSLMS